MRGRVIWPDSFARAFVGMFGAGGAYVSLR